MFETQNMIYGKFTIDFKYFNWRTYSQLQILSDVAKTS